MFSFDINELLIGLLKFKTTDEKVEVMQLQISPEFQNKGYGRSVMEQVIKTSKCKPVFLTVLKDNPAYQLYLNLGFVVVGEDEFEYHMQT